MKKKTVLAGLASAFLAGALGAAPARIAVHRVEPAPQRAAGELISLDLKDGDLRDVVATFGKLAHINVALDPDVRGSVTVRLHEVPWDQALEVILRSNGWGSVVEGGILRVGSPARLAGQ